MVHQNTLNAPLFFGPPTYRHMNYLNIAESGVKYHSPDISIDCQTLPTTMLSNDSKKFCIRELDDDIASLL